MNSTSSECMCVCVCVGVCVGVRARSVHERGCIRLPEREYVCVCVWWSWLLFCTCAVCLCVWDLRTLIDLIEVYHAYVCVCVYVCVCACVCMSNVQCKILQKLANLDKTQAYCVSTLLFSFLFCPSKIIIIKMLINSRRFKGGKVKIE